MCGLSGLLLAEPGLSHEDLSAQARVMSDTLVHRGPDDGGVWSDAETGVALAHRRLSIQDLSPLGHQPMISDDRRYVLVFNGEIYNFKILRRELEQEGGRFHGHSDTEVLLEAMAIWGVERAIRRCNGMFAFALWDRHARRLWLGRDRVGKKPLYYGWAGQSLIFASELKALWRHSDFDAGVNADALGLLLRFDYIPSPYCIHENTYKLAPGCLLCFDAADVRAGGQIHDPVVAQKKYWNAQTVMQTALASPFKGDIEEAETRLDTCLRDAVAVRMIADVPVGVFLSGGTDSSVVAALMQAQSACPVRSFTIGFENSHHDEAPLAKAVAGHLGMAHTELYVSGTDALEVVPHLPAMFDEPFADASQIPTALVARLARTGVTVVLSGDGGDELFFGYERYRRALRNWRGLQRIPSGLRKRLAAFQSDNDERSRVNGLFALMTELQADSISNVYRNRISRWRHPENVVLASHPVQTLYDQRDPLPGDNREADTMMYADFCVYLPDDLLCKVDRTSMSVSLEARAPMLDWRVAELAWSFPQSYKYQNGQSKYVLKRILRRYLPDTMVDRSKRGFGAPVSAWLQGALKEWATALLDQDLLRRQGYFDPDRVDRIWNAFRRGERKWHTHLWNILMFQAWHAYWNEQRATRYIAT